MEFIDNINPNPLASRNAADITLSAPNISKVLISVTIGSDTFSFQAEPYLANLKIRLSDILKSILQPIFHAPPQNENSSELIPEVLIKAEAAGVEPATWSRFAFQAGYASAFHESLMGDYFLTWKDQKCRTFVTGKEYIGVIIHNRVCTIRYTATFSDGTTDYRQVTLGEDEGRYKVFIVDVSYSRMENVFPGKTIVSYKVQQNDNAYAQEYEVSRKKPSRTFVFRNSLGVFDTVYAMGHISDGADYDVKKFIGEDRTENISDNNTREHIYVNSGHIDTKGERILWNEFAQSTDIWEYSDGSFREIILDKFDMKIRRGVSESLTFEYHYSEVPSGNGYEKIEL